MNPYNLNNLLKAHKIMMGGLVKEAEIFTWLPVETLIHENQEEYYKVLQVADNKGESTIFVEFMLQMICDVLKEISETQSDIDVADNVVVSVVTNEHNVIKLLKKDGSLSSKQLSVSIGVTQRQVQRILAKLKEQGIIVRHGNSKSGYWEVVEKPNKKNR